MAYGLTMVLASLGNLVGAPVQAYFLRLYGWRGAMIIQAALVLNLLPASLLLRRHTTRAKEGVQPTGPVQSSITVSFKKAMKKMVDLSPFADAILALFTLGSICIRAASAAFSVHLVSQAISEGMSPSLAVWLLSAYALGSTTGRLVVSFVATCVNRVALTSSLLLLSALGGVVLPYAPDISVSLAASCLLGFSLG